MKTKETEDAWHTNSAEFRRAAEQVRFALPFKTTITYTYSPGEEVGNSGKDHIMVLEDISSYHLHRKAGDTLCKSTKKFWGLTYVSDAGGTPQRSASCLRCLDIAQQIVAESSESAMSKITHDVE